jgi:hypothetical protein|nr:MAG TPA: hypothetical protein [Caudoviricetes sp.]
MSKFKVGDKVARTTKPDEEIGEVNCIVEDKYGCHVFVAFNKKKVYEMQLSGYNYDEDKLVKIDEYALSDDEIYTMLKPKLNNADVLKYDYYYRDHTMFNADEVVKAIALAYRFGYLRAKKGRLFKIGGEKE